MIHGIRSFFHGLVANITVKPRMNEKKLRQYRAWLRPYLSLNVSFTETNLPIMVQTLGKRKRRDQIAELDRDVNPATEEHHDDEPRTLLQQHFEAKFAPLENLSLQPPNAAANQKLLESPEEPGSDWEGISEPDDQPAEIVDWATSPLSSTVIPKDELKMFMV